VDNFEWERGWTQRFGLYELDLDTQARTPRAAAKLYAEICKSNTLTAEMVARYAPEVVPTMFPG
jgi:beta-glucosidase